jgi:hypothetical protein
VESQVWRSTAGFECIADLRLDGRPNLLSIMLGRWVAASRAGNPRSASGLTTPEVEVVPRKHPAAQHEARAGSQQVLGEHLLGEVIRVYPETGLKARIQRGVLRAEPRLPTGCIGHPRPLLLPT